jgi:hypothetical protein
MMADDRQRVFGARRGWSLAKRVRSRDSYGVLLVLILASMFVFTLDETTFARLASAIRLGS